MSRQTTTLRVEAYGVKGFKSTPWRRTFKSPEALCAWVEAHDAVVYAVRDADEQPTPMFAKTFEVNRVVDGEFVVVDIPEPPAVRGGK